MTSVLLPINSSIHSKKIRGAEITPRPGYIYFDTDVELVKSGNIKRISYIVRYFKIS